MQTRFSTGSGTSWDQVKSAERRTNAPRLPQEALCAGHVTPASDAPWTGENASHFFHLCADFSILARSDSRTDIDPDDFILQRRLGEC